MAIIYDIICINCINRSYTLNLIHKNTYQTSRDAILLYMQRDNDIVLSCVFKKKNRTTPIQLPIVRSIYIHGGIN